VPVKINVPFFSPFSERGVAVVFEEEFQRFLRKAIAPPT
jgi:hypothetical protein